MGSNVRRDIRRRRAQPRGGRHAARAGACYRVEAAGAGSMAGWMTGFSWSMPKKPQRIKSRTMIPTIQPQYILWRLVGPMVDAGVPLPDTLPGSFCSGALIGSDMMASSRVCGSLDLSIDVQQKGPAARPVAGGMAGLLARHHRQLDVAGLPGRVVNALRGLDVVRRLGEEDVRHVGLRIAVVEREPARLHLHHDAVAGAEHVVCRGQLEAVG